MIQDIVWIDIETTSGGVYPTPDRRIVEFASIITDAELNIISELDPIAVAIDDEHIERMPDDVYAMLNSNGVLARARFSNTTLEDLDDIWVKFVNSMNLYDDIVVAGNSVHFDKEAMRKDMPESYARLNSRSIDVSAISEVFSRWRPEVYENRPRKVSAHTAGSDVHESLEELRFFKDFMVGDGMLAL